MMDYQYVVIVLSTPSYHEELRLPELGACLIAITCSIYLEGAGGAHYVIFCTRSVHILIASLIWYGAAEV